MEDRLKLLYLQKDFLLKKKKNPYECLPRTTPKTSFLAKFLSGC